MAKNAGAALPARHGATAAIRPSLFLLRGWFLIIVHFYPKSSTKKEGFLFPATTTAAAARKREFALARGLKSCVTYRTHRGRGIPDKKLMDSPNSILARSRRQLQHLAKEREGSTPRQTEGNYCDD